VVKSKYSRTNKGQKLINQDVRNVTIYSGGTTFLNTKHILEDKRDD
jgi:hypothetical protein